MREWTRCPGELHQTGKNDGNLMSSVIIDDTALDGTGDDDDARKARDWN